MGPWIARRALPPAWRRVPWGLVWAIAVWLVERGRERVRDNLTEKEQQELLRLVKKSKGRPGTLPQRDRTRLKNIAGKATRGGGRRQLRSAAEPVGRGGLVTIAGAIFLIAVGAILRYATNLHVEGVSIDTAGDRKSVVWGKRVDLGG